MRVVEDVFEEDLTRMDGRGGSKDSPEEGGDSVESVNMGFTIAVDGV